MYLTQESPLKIDLTLKHGSFEEIRYFPSFTAGCGSVYNLASKLLTNAAKTLTAPQAKLPSCIQPGELFTNTLLINLQFKDSWYRLSVCFPGAFSTDTFLQLIDSSTTRRVFLPKQSYQTNVRVLKETM